MNEIKVLAFDMDNTLLTPEKKLSERTVHTLTELHRLGQHIVLTTGRPLPNVKPFLNQLDLNDPDDFVILFNGGRVENITTGISIFNQQLNLAHVQPTFHFLSELGLPVDIVAQEYVYSIKDYGQSPYVALLGDRMAYSQIPLAELPADLSFNKFVVAADSSKLNNLVQQLQTNPDLTEHLAFVRSRRELLEFVPQGVNKATGLSALLQHFNLTADNLMAFGDEENDASMLHLAKVSVAMDNAIPEIKAIATDITKSNAEDGVAVFLENYFSI